MKTKIIEAVQSKEHPGNWGKFLVGAFDEEWAYESRVDPERVPLLRACGWWGPERLWVLDLQTGEGAYFNPGGFAKADLDKHRVWGRHAERGAGRDALCPRFSPRRNRLPPLIRHKYRPWLAALLDHCRFTAKMGGVYALAELVAQLGYSHHLLIHAAIVLYVHMVQFVPC